MQVAVCHQFKLLLDPTACNKVAHWSGGTQNSWTWTCSPHLNTLLFHGCFMAYAPSCKHLGRSVNNNKQGKTAPCGLGSVPLHFPFHLLSFYSQCDCCCSYCCCCPWVPLSQCTDTKPGTLKSYASTPTYPIHPSTLLPVSIHQPSCSHAAA